MRIFCFFQSILKPSYDTSPSRAIIITSSTRSLSQNKCSQADTFLHRRFFSAMTSHSADKMEGRQPLSLIRREAEFKKVEAELFADLTKAGVSSMSPTAMIKLPSVGIEGLLGFLGDSNPFVKNARADQNEVWILDSTGYKTSEASTWRAEVTACFFQNGRGDIAKAAASIADRIGLDGEAGTQQQRQALIRERLRPFVDAIAPARTLPIVIEPQGARVIKNSLGPSNTSGISSETIEVGAHDQGNGAANKIESDADVANLPKAAGVSRLVEAEGWGVISDIDDTIKITQTPDPIGILRTTFAEPAQFTSHMPDFYKILNEQLQKPAWFYVSASPYNLYPFLRTFINKYYPPGQIFLRNATWQTLGGLLSTLTNGVQAYKTSQIDKIHGWFPERKFVCIGDSTQKDPETYAEAYKKYPGFIKAIYIRKVLDAPFMEEKNKPERFEKAFQGVPSHVWRVFVLPDDLKDHITHIAGEAHLGVVGALTGFFCGQERETQQQEKDRVPL